MTIMISKISFDIDSINKKFDIVSRSNTKTEQYLTAEQEKNLLIKSKNGCKKSKELLVKNLLPFIYSMAHRFSDKIISNKIDADVKMDDLVQCGVIGALRSINNFDVSRKCRLCTFAEGFIKDEFKQGYKVRKLDIASIERKEEFIKNTSESLFVSEFDANRYLKIFENGLRSDIQNKKLDKFISGFMDENLKNINHDLSIKKILGVLLRLISMLPYREKMIINSHFGIGSERLSIKKIAEYSELSIDRVKEIRSTAILKLRLDLLQEAQNLVNYLSQNC